MRNLRSPKARRTPLTFRYRGRAVQVDPDCIHPGMRVPDITGTAPWLEQIPGGDAASLFFDAVLNGALIAPPGITIDRYGDDAEDGSRFILGAYSHAIPRRGLTCGPRDVVHIARRSEYDPRAVNDPHIVQEALEFFAAELGGNATLGVPSDRITLAPATNVPAAVTGPEGADNAPDRENRRRRRRRRFRRAVGLLLLLILMWPSHGRTAAQGHAIPSPKRTHQVRIHPASRRGCWLARTGHIANVATLRSMLVVGD